MMNRRDILKAGIGAGIAPILFPFTTHAQETYPARPIKVVVGFSPGGPTDIVARRFSEMASPLLGQQMLVENRAGASGGIGAVEVARAKPDGYTLLLATSSSHATNPTMMAKPTYDPIKDYEHVALVAVVPVVIAVNPQFPAKTLAEAVAEVRKNPGKYAYGSAGAGSITHLAGELFKHQAGGLDLTHVPYRGAADGIQDVLAGHVAFMMETPATTLAHHKAGRLRILAMCTEKRSAAAPDVPTAIEGGVAGMIANTFNVLLAPAGTPTPVVDRLASTARQVIADPKFASFAIDMGFDRVPDTTPSATRQYVQSELEKWRPTIKATGIVID